MGSKHNQRSYRKTKPPGRPPLPKKAKVEQEQRRNLSGSLRGRVDLIANTIKMSVELSLLDPIEKYLRRRKWTKGTGNEVDGHFIDDIPDPKVIGKLEVVARAAGFLGAKVLNGKTDYAGEEYFGHTGGGPVALRLLGGNACAEHSDYDASHKVHHAVYTLYIVLKASATIFFELNYDKVKKEVFELEEGEVFVFPSRLNHIVHQKTGGRTVVACHFITNKFKKKK